MIDEYFKLSNNQLYIITNALNSQRKQQQKRAKKNIRGVYFVIF